MVSIITSSLESAFAMSTSILWFRILVPHYSSFHFKAMILEIEIAVWRPRLFLSPADPRCKDLTDPGRMLRLYMLSRKDQELAAMDE